jgi:hypothetical protein
MGHVSSRLSWRRCCAGAVTVLCVAAPLRAEVPVVVIGWSLGGETTQYAVPPGSRNGEGFAYEGRLVDPATGLALTYELLAHPSASIGGTLSIDNVLSVPIQCTIEVSMFFDEPLEGGSELAGTGLVGLTVGEGGGELSALPPWLWQATLDGAIVGPAASLFADPFEMTISGPGSASVWSDFGLEEPVPAPPVLQRLGYLVGFSVTDGDHAAVSSSVVAQGGPAVCPADLDGDGVVGFDDLVLLLGAWGTDAPSADLDGDGTVGITDLIQMLANWGLCE